MKIVSAGIVFKRTPVRITKPMSIFNALTRMATKGDFDHCEFIFNVINEEGLKESICIGADGGKEYKSVRVIDFNKWFEESGRPYFEIIDLYDLGFDSKDVYDFAFGEIGAPYNYRFTLFEYPIRTILGLKAKPRNYYNGKNYYACSVFVDYYLNNQKFRKKGFSPVDLYNYLNVYNGK